MTSPTEPTTERLARALEEAGAPESMIEAARAGIYDDFKSPLARPITTLVRACQKAGLIDLAHRAMNGEFDGTQAEADAWMASSEGQAARRGLDL